MTRGFLFVVACVQILFGGNAVQAGEIGLNIVRTDGTPVVYSIEALAALEQHEVTTQTSVTDGPQVFVGPLMRDVLADAGLEAETITAIALNDYEIAIPTSDFARFDVIAALSMNGVSLTPRDKGPVWIVYPRDDHPELQDIRYDYRWVWQLIRIEPR